MSATSGSASKTGSDAGTDRHAVAVGRRARLLAVAVAAGAGLGGFSLLADGVLGLRLFDILGNLASPWGLAAFAVGWPAATRRAGAGAGALALLTGVAVYYVIGAARSYVLGGAIAVWAVASVLVGPVMGAAGAAVSGRRGRPPAPAVAAPAVLLLAEALYLAVDRRMWAYDLAVESQRWNDVVIVAVLVAVAVVLPAVLVRDKARLRLLYPAIGALGAVGGAAYLALDGLVLTVI